MGLVLPDYGLLFWMVLTFLIVLFILKKYAWKPILSSLKERENSIEDSLKLAEKAREEMAKLQVDNENILAEARRERSEMLKDAKKMKLNIIEEAKKSAEVEAEKMIHSAKLSIENEKNSAIHEMKENIASLSIKIAEKILKNQLKEDKAQKELMDKYLKNIDLN